MPSINPSRGSSDSFDPNKGIQSGSNKVGHMGERVAKDRTKTGRLTSHNSVQVAPSYPKTTGKANPCTFSGTKNPNGAETKKAAQLASRFFLKP